MEPACRYKRFQQWFNRQDFAELQPVSDESLLHYGVNLSILRLDNFAPQMSGNKWFKLKYLLHDALQNNAQHIVSFGGAHSNHLAAMAWICQQLELSFTAVIRGEQPKEYSPTLNFLVACKTQLFFCSRENYRDKNNKIFLNALQQKLAFDYIIPEGGSHSLALPGCAEIINHIYQQCDKTVDAIALPVASGGTVAGLLSASSGIAIHAYLVVAMSKAAMLMTISDLLSTQMIAKDLVLHDQYHGGGYAKINKPLIEFIHYFNDKHNILLEPIYSGKLLLGVYRDIANGVYPEGSHIVAVHTGGLQGLPAMQKKMQRIMDR